MHNPPHPGEFIQEVYLKPYNLSIRLVAAKLNVSPSTFSRLIKKQSNVSSDMALRLSKTLGRSPESWLIMQNNYNLWQAQKEVNLEEVEKLIQAQTDKSVVLRADSSAHHGLVITIMDGLRKRGIYKIIVSTVKPLN